MISFVTDIRADKKTAILCFLVALLFVLNPPVYAQETDTEEIGEQAPGFDISAETVDSDILDRAASADSLWRRWMDADNEGVRTYWFRRSFEITDPPAGGNIWMTADDDYSLYLNGKYIAADETEEVDWNEVKEYDIGDYLIIGRNIIAIQVDDVDQTRHGLLFGITYETIPDINTQLDRMVQSELDAQEARRSEQIRQAEAARTLRESRREPPSPEELHDMRAIEKNKLD